MHLIIILQNPNFISLIFILLPFNFKLHTQYSLSRQFQILELSFIYKGLVYLVSFYRPTSTETSETAIQMRKKKIYINKLIKLFPILIFYI
ncbi:hypothetical protein pb186bvf_020362 [Paramecium bursaria]